MDSNIKLGKIIGIPISLHWSWFVIFLLLGWSLATGTYPNSYPGLAQPLYWGLGLFSAAMLFVSVLAHELGHSWVALRNNIPVQRITLFIFGGIAQIGTEPDTPGKEFRITLAGPLVSLILGVLFGGLYLLAQPVTLLAAPSRWLMQVNLSLALFNLLPGFPLDGGRIFRSVIWAVTKSYEKATRIAGLTGQVIAFGFIAFGFFLAINRDFSNGLWLMFIGWFLNSAARAAVQSAKIQQALSGIHANELMDRRVDQVSGNITLNDLVQKKVVAEGNRSFMVSERNQPVGLITLRDIAAVPSTDWQRTLVSQIMEPWGKLITVTPNTGLANVLQTMEISQQTLVPVVENNHFAGLLSHQQILQYLRSRQESGI